MSELPKTKEDAMGFLFRFCYDRITQMPDGDDKLTAISCMTSAEELLMPPGSDDIELSPLRKPPPKEYPPDPKEPGDK